MSAEVVGYIQIRQTDGTYILLPLFVNETKDREYVCIWGGGDYVEAMQNHDGVLLSQKESDHISSLIYILNDEEDDEDKITWSSMSLPYLKLLAQTAKGTSKEVFKEIATLVESAITLSGTYISSIDEVRFIYYISY